jgi:hypothetical protein
MNQPINDGGPAFPLQSIGPEFQPGYSGMTLRQYAAIKLCVPDSGLPWLDEMIVQSNRERLAAAALEKASRGSDRSADEIAKRAFYIADAMLKAREAK